MTNFEPAQALIRFVTAFIERSLREDDGALPGRQTDEIPQSGQNTSSEE